MLFSLSKLLFYAQPTFTFCQTQTGAQRHVKLGALLTLSTSNQYQHGSEHLIFFLSQAATLKSVSITFVVLTCKYSISITVSIAYITYIHYILFLNPSYFILKTSWTSTTMEWQNNKRKKYKTNRPTWSTVFDMVVHLSDHILQHRILLYTIGTSEQSCFISSQT